jgi:hypothetical protein
MVKNRQKGLRTKAYRNDKKDVDTRVARVVIPEFGCHLPDFLPA